MPDPALLMLIVVIVLGLGFDYINGCTGYFGHPRGSQRCRVARVGRRAQ